MARMIDADALIEWFRPYLHVDEPIPANVVIEAIRCMPTLTQPKEPERAGLYGKYTVYKNKDGSLVPDCFVLRPAKDPAAVIALRAYAAATDNAELSADIINWVGAEPNEPLTFIERREMGRKPVWLDDEKTFGILQFWDDNNVDAVFLDPNGCICVKSVIGKKIYRRPPEGDA